MLKTSLSLLFVHCALLLGACALPGDEAALGRLTIPLRSGGSQGSLFALTGQLTITLQDGQERVVDLSSDGTETVTTLPAGVHLVELGGWSLSRVTDNVLAPVEQVQLLSENPQVIEIVADQTERLTLRFFAPGENVTFGEGSLAVDVEVVEGGPCDDAGRLVSGLAITKVSLNQGVQVDLAANGAPIATRNAPVVQGRPGLLRVHVAPAATFEPHEVRARLVLGGVQDSSALEARLTPTAVSSDTDLGSTFNFALTAEQIANNEYRIELLEDECTGEPGAASEATFPQVNYAPFAAEPVGTLHVAIVPVRYQADGSNRTPGVDDAAIQRVISEIYRLYPVEDVQVEVLAPLSFNTPIQPSGTGYQPLLQSLQQLRNASNAGNKFFVGVVQPRASYDLFCSTGCLPGLGFLNGQPNSPARVAVTLGYFERDETYAAILRQLGQNHGRSNATGCNATGTDPGYPYANGEIGVVGYDLTTGALHPQTEKDVMSICAPPRWISDYTYRNLADRIRLEQ